MSIDRIEFHLMPTGARTYLKVVRVDDRKRTLLDRLRRRDPSRIVLGVFSLSHCDYKIDRGLNRASTVSASFSGADAMADLSPSESQA